MLNKTIKSSTSQGLTTKYSAIAPAAAIFALCMSFGYAAAQTFETPPEPDAGTGTVTNGVPTGPSKWPATLVSSSALGACTATIIGPRTVLTAAHCVNDGASMIVGSKTVSCKRHKDYNSQLYTSDIALCISSSDFATSKFERLNTSPAIPPAGSTIRILGYGCTVSGGHASQNLFTGTVGVTGKPGTIITLAGSAQVCQGDSGGAAYVESNESPPIRRSVVGVNSTLQGTNTSNVTDVADPSIVAFIQEWRTANNAKICGYDALPSCHQ